MKGLLLKDLYSIGSYKKQYLLVTVFMCIWGVIMKSTSFPAMYLTLMCGMITLTTMTMDEQAKFNRYALTMPLTPRELVREKYVLLICLIVAGAGLGSIVILLGDLFGADNMVNFNMVSLGSVLVLFLLIYSIMLPIAFKLGVEKARMLFIGLMALVFVIVFGAMHLLEGIAVSEQLGEILVAGAILTVAILAIGGLLLSYQISVRIVSKKEW